MTHDAQSLGNFQTHITAAANALRTLSEDIHSPDSELAELPGTLSLMVQDAVAELTEAANGVVKELEVRMRT